jgi:hypothetical protein
VPPIAENEDAECAPEPLEGGGVAGFSADSAAEVTGGAGGGSAGGGGAGGGAKEGDEEVPPMVAPWSSSGR